MRLGHDKKWEDYQERYATENDAILGHIRAVEEFKERRVHKQAAETGTETESETNIEHEQQ